MKSSSIGIIATSLAVLFSGFSGFFIVSLVGGISALIPYMPSATISVLTGIVDPNSALANGCCICIPIPLVVSIFALFRRAKASNLQEPLSPSK